MESGINLRCFTRFPKREFPKSKMAELMEPGGLVFVWFFPWKTRFCFYGVLKGGGVRGGVI